MNMKYQWKCPVPFSYVEVIVNRFFYQTLAVERTAFNFNMYRLVFCVKGPVRISVLVEYDVRHRLYHRCGFREQSL